MNKEPDTKWNVQTSYLESQSGSSESGASTPPSVNESGENDRRACVDKPPLSPHTWPSWFGAGVLSVFSFLPIRIRRVLVSGLAWLYVEKLGRNSRHVRVAKINLTACFPELSEAERHQLLKDYLFTLLLAISQLPHLWWFGEKSINHCTKKIGLEPVREALANGEACVFLITHTGSIDAGMVSLSTEIDMIGIYRPFNNPVVDWLIHRARMRFRGKPVARGNGFREIVRSMKRQAILCYLCDEDYGVESSVFAPLFSHDKATLTVLPKLVKLTNAKVFPMATYINPSTGCYEMHIQPAIEGYPCGDDVKQAAAINQAIENSIRKDPAQYLWKLKIFRSCPKGKDSRYSQVARGELSAEKL